MAGAWAGLLRGGGRKSPNPPSTGKRSRQFGHPSDPSITRLFSMRSAIRIKPNPGPQRGQISRSVSRICTGERGSVVLDGQGYCERGLWSVMQSRRNSSRVIWSSRNDPRMADVIVFEFCFCTPRIIIQRW